MFSVWILDLFFGGFSLRSDRVLFSGIFKVIGGFLILILESSWVREGDLIVLGMIRAARIL